MKRRRCSGVCPACRGTATVDAVDNTGVPYKGCANCRFVSSLRPATAPRWRVGRTLGRTLYVDDKCVGMVDTPELAAAIVEAMNARVVPS